MSWQELFKISGLKGTGYIKTTIYLQYQNTELFSFAAALKIEAH
jgi:hypothetical protein